MTIFLNQIKNYIRACEITNVQKKCSCNMKWKERNMLTPGKKVELQQITKGLISNDPE